MARLLAIAAVVLALLASSAAGATAPPKNHDNPFNGLGTWVDIYSPQWNHPESAVKTMADHGVKTLYLETGNYRHDMSVFRPAMAGRFIDAAHAAGIKVVAWYLPALLYLKADARKALGAIRFHSASGQRFNGFALDIEATTVRSMKLRNERLIALSQRIRYAVQHQYALGAITPSPVGMSPSYWPNIPYRALTQYYKAFLPMAYSTMRGITSRSGTLNYLAQTVSDIRAASGDPNLPIHLIGGLTGPMGTKAMIGFLQAINKTKPVGFSLYAFDHTTPAFWQALERAS